MVPEAGLEPACPFEREILNLLCIPFHHSGILVLPPGIEPGSTVLQTAAMTTSAKVALG
jgi:hypothetical protein